MTSVDVRHYDASVEVGIPLILTGHLPALRCERCGAVAIMGYTLERARDEAVMLVVKLERQLSGREAVFLRKAALKMGQGVLARSIGVSRPTVARWEGSKSVPAEHDLALRGLVLGSLLRQAQSGTAPWNQRRSELIEIAAEVLPEARRARAPASPRPLKLVS
jgi:DNA-binding transcriptional regulator YiaG